MKPILATLVAIAVLAVAAPAWARPIDALSPIPSDGAVEAPRPPTAPSSGTETWVVVAAAALAFAAGAGAARLAPALRPRVS